MMPCVSLSGLEFGGQCDSPLAHRLQVELMLVLQQFLSTSTNVTVWGI